MSLKPTLREMLALSRLAPHASRLLDERGAMMLRGFGSRKAVTKGRGRAWAGAAGESSQPSGGEAADFYVSTSGNDAWDGTAPTFQGGSVGPKRNINAGAMPAVGFAPGAGANKIVEVLGGMYNEKIDDWPTGTSNSAKFTVRARQGDTVIIRPSSGDNGSLVDFSPGLGNQFVDIVGLVLDGIDSPAEVNTARVNAGTHYVRLINCELKNNQRMGSFLEGDNCAIIGGSIHDGPFLAPGSGGGFAYPVYVAGSNNTLDGLEIYNFPSFGFHVWHDETEVGNIIRNCIIHHGTQSDFGSTGIIYGPVQQDGQLYNNVIYAMGFEGHGMAISGSGHLIFGNTVYNCVHIGIYLNNNTGCFVKNNISYANETAYLDTGSGTDATNNSFDGTNPQFQDPGGGDFHLTASTPNSIRNGGATLGSPWNTDREGTQRPQGTGYSMGAYERS